MRAGRWLLRLEHIVAGDELAEPFARAELAAVQIDVRAVGTNMGLCEVAVEHRTDDGLLVVLDDHRLLIGVVQIFRYLQSVGAAGEACLDDVARPHALLVDVDVGAFKGVAAVDGQEAVGRTQSQVDLYGLIGVVDHDSARLCVVVGGLHHIVVCAEGHALAHVAVAVERPGLAVHLKVGVCG